MMTRPTKRIVWLLVRIILVLALFAWLVSRIELAPLLAELRQLNLQYVYLIPLVWAVSFALASLRWKLLLDKLSEGISLTSIALLNLIGAFYSSFIPGNISGDVIKGLYLSRAHIRRLDAISAALADRALGFAVTIWLGLLALLLTAEVRQVIGVSQAVVGMLLALSLVAPVLFLALLPRLGWLRERLPSLLKRVFDVAVIYARHPRTLLVSGIISGFYFLGWVVILWLIGLAVRLEGISIVSMAFALAIVNLTQVIPISVNGLGVREGAMLVLLPIFGVTNEKAVVFSLFIATLGWCVAFIGGLVVIRDVKILRAAAPSNG